MNSIVYGTALCLGGFLAQLVEPEANGGPIEGHQGLQNIESAKPPHG